MKTIRELEESEKLTDATVRGDHAFPNTNICLAEGNRQTSHGNETEDHHVKYDRRENLGPEASKEVLNEPTKVENLQDIHSSENASSSLPQFVIKYINNIVTNIEPGTLSTSFTDNALEQENITKRDEVINQTDLQVASNTVLESNMLPKDHEQVPNDGEQKNSIKSTPVLNLNVLDEPLFPDFSLSVLRFQEAIESYTQAVFNDAFETLMSGEKTKGQLDNYGHSSNKANSDLSGGQAEAKESQDSNYFPSCELTGENTVPISNESELEVVEEYIEAQSAVMCGITSSTEEDLPDILPNSDVQEVGFVDRDIGRDSEKKSSEEKCIEHSSDSTVWIPIPIFRAHSDSTALTSRENALTITDVSELGSVEDNMDCSPVIQEIEDTVIRKSVATSENITFEDISCSVCPDEDVRVEPGNYNTSLG